MNTTTPYKIVKLTNGDNLICQINDDIDNGEYKINAEDSPVWEYAGESQIK